MSKIEKKIVFDFLLSSTSVKMSVKMNPSFRMSYDSPS